MSSETSSTARTSALRAENAVAGDEKILVRFRTSTNATVGYYQAQNRPHVSIEVREVCVRAASTWRIARARFPGEALRAVPAIATIASIGYCLLATVAGIRFARKSKEDAADATSFPPVSILKPLK